MAWYLLLLLPQARIIQNPGGKNASRFVKTRQAQSVLFVRRARDDRERMRNADSCTNRCATSVEQFVVVRGIGIFG